MGVNTHIEHPCRIVILKRASPGKYSGQQQVFAAPRTKAPSSLVLNQIFYGGIERQHVRASPAPNLVVRQFLSAIAFPPKKDG
jgi:hypothetical protein